MHDAGLEPPPGFLLRELGRYARTWRTPIEIAAELFGYQSVAEGHVVVTLAISYLLVPLEYFGLIEHKNLRRGRSQEVTTYYRKTPLFDRFLTFGGEVGRPAPGT